MELEHKLPPDIKEKWLTALRSGKYQQGRSLLRSATTNSYCCLGVLAEVCNLRWAKADGEYALPDRSDPELLNFNWIAQAAGLPEEVRVVLKQGVYDPNSPSVERKLSHFNDDGPLTFGEIADWIEQNL